MNKDEDTSPIKEEDTTTKMLFEPVLVLSRLAQLSLYPMGTRLYVRDNTVRIHSTGITQSITRWIAGDSREDLTYLYEPLQRFCRIYMTKTNKAQRNILKSVIERALTGLEVLRKTYGTHRIIDHSLAYYQTFLVRCLHPSTFGDSRKKHPLGPHDASLLADIDDASEAGTDSKIDKLSGVWALDDIRMLRTMLDETDDSTSEDQKKSRLATLGSFLDSKELEVHKALDNIHRP